MSVHDLMFRPASELAGMVRLGDVSARELVQASLDRIEELNPTLNAFVQVDTERALLAAEEVSPCDERPFAGVPIAIKNLRAVKGLRLTVPAHLDVHVVLDNSSTHKTPSIQRWLLRHPRFTLHFTPTYSSWLNLVERWFAELDHEVDQTKRTPPSP